MMASTADNASYPWGRVLACGLVMGVAGDLLLRANGGPGLNFALLFLGVAVGIVVVLPRERWSGEAIVLVASGVILGASIAVRDSPGLNVLAFLAASVAFALVGLEGGRPWLHRSGLSDIAEALGTAAGRSAAGLLPSAWLKISRSSPAPGTGRRGGHTGPGRAAIAARGVVIAAPFLLLFGVLLVNADPIYEELVEGIVRIDLGPLLEHLVPICVLAWLAAGYYTGVRSGSRLPGLTDRRVRRSIVGVGEAGVAVGLVDLLFLSFVVVQVRYLFGGSELVEATAGLTYAEYARSGAVELAVCTALAIPSLLLADWSVRRPTEGSGHRIFRSLAALQIVLLLVVLASAFQRLRIYQDAYGLTVSRVYGTVGLAWLGVVGLLFLGTVLRGSRERFAPLGLGAATVAVAFLIVWNPDAGIARANLARFEVDDTPDLDVSYLGELSADAVPTLLAATDRLPPHGQCLVASRLLERWGPSTPAEDWRAWDMATARARSAVAAAQARLGSMTRGGCS